MLRVRQQLAIVLAVIGLSAIAAAAPSSSWAFGSNGGTEVSTGTAPADGTMLTHTDEIPAGATQGSFGVQPQPGTDAHAFDEVTAVLVEDFPWLAKNSKRSQATLACVLMSYLPFANAPTNEPITFTEVERQVMLLQVCLQMAASIPASTPSTPARDTAHSAAGACGRLNPAITVTITRPHGKYRGVVTGKIHNANRPRLTVTCRRAGKGLLLTIKPRRHGQRLRAAAGPSLAIAYRNPTSKPVGIRTTFKVN
jgi:hypothetical protein